MSPPTWVWWVVLVVALSVFVWVVLAAAALIVQAALGSAEVWW